MASQNIRRGPAKQMTGARHYFIDRQFTLSRPMLARSATLFRDIDQSWSESGQIGRIRPLDAFGVLTIFGPIPARFGHLGRFGSKLNQGRTKSTNFGAMAVKFGHSCQSCLDVALATRRASGFTGQTLRRRIPANKLAGQHLRPRRFGLLLALGGGRSSKGVDDGMAHARPEVRSAEIRPNMGARG